MRQRHLGKWHQALDISRTLLMSNAAAAGLGLAVTLEATWILPTWHLQQALHSVQL
jgi:hypothetical protein